MTIAKTFQYINCTLPTVMFIRHANKLLSNNIQEHLQPLSEKGKQEARDLGVLIQEKFGAISTITSSPIQRCLNTAQLLAMGNQANMTIEQDPILRHAYVENQEKATQVFMNLSMPDIVSKQIQGEHLPGFIPLRQGTQNLLKLVLKSFDQGNSLDIYVTHDVLLTTLFCSLTETSHDKIENEWIECLDGICIQQLENGDLKVYRGDRKFDIRA